MIRNLISGIILFEKIISGIRFYIWSEVPVDIISFFLISDFLAEYLKAFLRNSTQLTLKIICSRNIAKNVSDFTNFLANIFLFGVRKNICTAPFLDAQELHSWSTLKANVCIFLYISVRKFLFQILSKILSGGIGDWWRLNNFLKAARCLGLVKCFTIFHFNWNFSKFNYFLVFWYFYQ